MSSVAGRAVTQSVPRVTTATVFTITRVSAVASPRIVGTF